LRGGSFALWTRRVEVSSYVSSCVFVCVYVIVCVFVLPVCVCVRVLCVFRTEVSSWRLCLDVRATHTFDLSCH